MSAVLVAYATREAHTAACLLVLAALLAPREAHAQCGATRSSCSTCHDGARAPLPAQEAWHDDHAFADLCATCHGGHGDVSELPEAHADLVDPLANEEEHCGSCHGASTHAFADRYRASRGGDADAGTAVVTNVGGGNSVAPPKGSERHAHGERGANVTLAAVVGAVGALGAVLVRRRERARSRRAAAARTDATPGA